MEIALIKAKAGRWAGQSRLIKRLSQAAPSLASTLRKKKRKEKKRKEKKSVWPSLRAGAAVGAAVVGGRRRGEGDAAHHPQPQVAIATL